jgi:FkbM family methyltransferase
MGLGVKTKFLELFDYFYKRRFPALRFHLLKDTTQYGEFRELFALCGYKKNGLVVEVGANDGLFCSNSYPFISREWHAILIEPNPDVFASLQSRYMDSAKVQCFNLACGSHQAKLPLFLGKAEQSGYSTLSTESSDWYSATRSSNHIFVSVEPLTSILQIAGCPAQFDILSIDTEGYDFFVLQGLDFNFFTPKIIITEDEKPPFTKQAEKHALLQSRGYRLHCHFQSNAIWVLESK